METPRKDPLDDAQAGRGEWDVKRRKENDTDNTNGSFVIVIILQRVICVCAAKGRKLATILDNQADVRFKHAYRGMMLSLRKEGRGGNYAR